MLQAYKHGMNHYLLTWAKDSFNRHTIIKHFHLQCS